MNDLTITMLSQSLLHQVTYSDIIKKDWAALVEGLNPFYIRSRIPTGFDDFYETDFEVSQSLLHQVTYSDVCWF